MYDGVTFGSQDTRMTSDVVWPDRFGEEAVKGKINQVVIYLVRHDKIIIDSPIL